MSSLREYIYEAVSHGKSRSSDAEKTIESWIQEFERKGYNVEYIDITSYRGGATDEIKHIIRNHGIAVCDYGDKKCIRANIHWDEYSIDFDRKGKIIGVFRYNKINDKVPEDIEYTLSELDEHGW